MQMWTEGGKTVACENEGVGAVGVAAVKNLDLTVHAGEDVPAARPERRRLYPDADRWSAHPRLRTPRAVPVHVASCRQRTGSPWYSMVRRRYAVQRLVFDRQPDQQIVVTVQFPGPQAFGPLMQPIAALRPVRQSQVPMQGCEYGFPAWLLPVLEPTRRLIEPHCLFGG